MKPAKMLLIAVEQMVDVKLMVVGRNVWHVLKLVKHALMLLIAVQQVQPVHLQPVELHDMSYVY